jgi:dipeptidyl aminopeptidase/acylaminoacyl peptidase
MPVARLQAYVLVCALSAIATTSAALAQSPPGRPPVEAFASLPAMTDVWISPDGKHVAARQNYHGRYAAVIYEIDAPASTTPAYLTDPVGDITGLRWANNDRLLIWLNQTKTAGGVPVQPYGMIISVDTKAENPVQLPYTVINGLNAGDPDHIIMPAVGSNGISFAINLYRVDVLTGKAERVVIGTGSSAMSSGTHTLYWVLDGHGNPIARVDRTGEPIADHLLIVRNDDLVEVATWFPASDLGENAVRLSADGKSLLWLAHDDTSGMTGVVAYDRATGKIAPLYFNPKYDVISLIVDNEGFAIGARFVDDATRGYYFDPALRALQRGLDAAFPGQDATAESMDQTLKRVIVRSSSATQPPTYFLLDRSTHKATFIGGEYPNLHAGDLGETKPYYYKARDGLEIPAYLTLPPGKTAKALPAVVLLHADSDDRDSMDFDWRVQFLANRGYAVLQPNIRGSGGYGFAFRKAGFHEWGLKMQDDISDGVFKLMNDGIADPKRICIMGSRFGGYAALAGAAFTPQLYACAIGYAGNFDLPYLVEDISKYYAYFGSHTPQMVSWTARVGSLTEDLPRLKATSPDLHTEFIQAPVLLIHFEKDSIVPIEQSIRMDEGLRDAGKTVEFVRLPGEEDHYMLKAETRVQFLTTVERFLKGVIGD